MNTAQAKRMPAFLAIVFVVTLVFVPAALAAPVSLADTEVWVQLWPEGEPSTNVVIVGAQLPQGTKLPATVRMPIPEGATVYWAGEIMGADPVGDLQREFTMVDTGNGTAVEFTAETTLSVQVDATYGTIEIDGNDLSSRLDWVQSVESSLTSFAVLMPSGTGDVDIQPAPPGDPEENAAGETLYTLPPAELEPGDTRAITVTYRRAGVEDVPADSGSTVLWVLGGLLAVAVVALVAALMAQKRRTAGS